MTLGTQPTEGLPGAVLLFHGRGVVSTLIRWQTRSPWSHAALLMGDGRIVESWQGAGVRVRRLDDWRGVVAFDVPEMTKQRWAIAIGWALSQRGKGYDYRSVARFLSRRRAIDNDRMFCSELVFEALARSGVGLLSRVSAPEVSPGMLSWSPKMVML